MQYALDIDVLLAAADRLPGSEDAFLDAQEQLLALGLEAELLSELLDEALEALGSRRIAALGEPARALASAARDSLEAAAACPLEALALPPLLAADPETSERAQVLLLAGLEARERLHRLSFLDRALGLDVSVPAGVDARLRERIEAAVPLGPSRAARAAALTEEALASRWWWTLPGAQADGALQLGALDALAAWMEERSIPGDTGPRLKLDTQEARALLATPRGRWIAERLEDRLDLSAAAPDQAERSRALGARTLADLREGIAGRSPSRPMRTGLVVPLTARPLEPVQARAAAASGFELAHRGLAAIVQIEVHGAAAIPGLGIVARGRKQGSELAAWLVVPSVEVEAVTLEGGNRLSSDEWQRGGLLFCGVDGSAPLRLLVLSEGEERGLNLMPAAFQQDDPLLDAVADLGAGLPDDARESLKRARAALSEPEVRALSGLEKALDDWRQHP